MILQLSAHRQRPHFDICKKLIKKNISLLVEKPIVDNLKDADELLNLIANTGSKVLPGHGERYNPAVVFLKNKLADMLI